MIVLVNPPNPPGTVSNKDTMGGLGQVYPAGTLSKMPPLDLLYCAAVLRQRRIPFEMVECLGLALDRDLFLRRIVDLAAELVVIRTSLPTFDWDLEVAGLVKEGTGCRVFFMGPCMSYLGEEALRCNAVDGVLLGEPEVALAEVVCGGGNQHPSLMTKAGDSGCKQTPALVNDLDQLPFPAWDLTPWRVYSGAELMKDITPFATMLTSRGCAHGCLYCPYPVTQGKTLRYHSVDRVVEEMKWLEIKLGVRSVLFRDPEFAINRNRVLSFCEKLIGSDCKVVWRCETRVENLDVELIRLMSRAGCIGLNMGIESFDESVLSCLGRKAVAVDHVKSVVREARKEGIATFCFFILGLPGETIKTSLNTISSAVALGCDHLQFTAATPYPGTGLYSWALERGYLESQSRSLFTGYDAVMQNGHLSAQDIGNLCDFAGTNWALQLMRNHRKPFAFASLWHIGKLGFLAAEKKRWLVERSRTLGE